jgi:hypothetical protein
MRRLQVTLLSFLAAACAAAACSRAAPPEPQGPGLGSIMVDVGRRFELCGRAAQAGKFELAAFEVVELREAFDEEIPHAQMPKEGPVAHIPATAKAFASTNLPELERAADSKDAKTFTDAFGRAADACNACHAASQKAFIVVPRVPGRPVPEIEPPAPARSGGGLGF